MTEFDAVDGADPAATVNGSAPAVAVNGADPVAADVPIRDAATVVLLRDSAHGVQTWLLTRVAQMAFAPQMTVFPGGRVDPTDSSIALVATEVAARFRCSELEARSLVGAAARETFEEAGVLLTSPPLHLGADRSEDVEAGRISFGDLLREHFVAVDESLLRPWARWVTPAGETRRYDTRFFVAAMPIGAHAEDLTTESSTASWVTARDAIAQFESGERLILPPTLATLHSIAAHDTVEQVLDAAAGRDLSPVRPAVTVDSDGMRVTLDDGTVYQVQAPPAAPPASV
ncbi:hypothetical protein SAMN05892883_1350 [Jatrophihabitans sp. GAS493]|uniref:NUDIX hydrolase n=1 Tax=Jatrophihabitans sp. GAS493 TaxID=1907575 RepID=UPI000BB94524|nr:NUDIX domain-containing protein [Jatrophihabitans sp. GAS493]SOD71888.1 hypothetical protein SAMN05892883_1350 [Jatrophihabitans sp. GAS493]